MLLIHKISESSSGVDIELYVCVEGGGGNQIDVVCGGGGGGGHNTSDSR